MEMNTAGSLGRTDLHSANQTGLMFLGVRCNRTRGDLDVNDVNIFIMHHVMDYGVSRLHVSGPLLMSSKARWLGYLQL